MNESEFLFPPPEAGVAIVDDVMRCCRSTYVTAAGSAQQPLLPITRRLLVDARVL